MHPFLAAAQSMLPQVLSDIEAIVNIESPSRNASQVAKSAAQLESIIQRVAHRDSVLVDSVVGPHVLVPARGTARILLLGHHDTVHPMGTLAARPFSNDGKVLRGPGVFALRVVLRMLGWSQKKELMLYLNSRTKCSAFQRLVMLNLVRRSRPRWPVQEQPITRFLQRHMC